jgi:hypothetical protein
MIPSGVKKSVTAMSNFQIKQNSPEAKKRVSESTNWEIIYQELAEIYT